MAARAMGIDANVVKRVAFMCSAAYAGVAGGLYTTFASFIHPESLGFWTTILILIMIVVGGVIPAQDYPFLLEHGASAIFGPGTVIPAAAKQMLEILNQRLRRAEEEGA